MRDNNLGLRITHVSARWCGSDFLLQSSDARKVQRRAPISNLLDAYSLLPNKLPKLLQFDERGVWFSLEIRKMCKSVREEYQPNAAISEVEDARARGRKGRARSVIRNRCGPAVSRRRFIIRSANTPRDAAVLETRNGRYDVPITVKRWKAIIKAAARRAITVVRRVAQGRKGRRGEARRKEKPMKRKYHRDDGRGPTAPIEGRSRHSRPPESSSIYSTFHFAWNADRRGIIFRAREGAADYVVRGTDEIYLTPSRVPWATCGSLVLLRKIGSRYVDSVRCHVNLR